jgi:hypothetical protein
MRFGNNYMDKLDLPIPGIDGPPSYEDSVLRFEREPDGAFRLSLGTPSEVRRWKRSSERAGTLLTMRGGRQWGVLP